MLLFIACETIADMLYHTTTLLGCQKFRKAQSKACECVERQTGELKEEL